ncbi:MAG TPA: ArsI/CadI family heavy metal resistance metalloenzyme [Casimicrobiaceae bacterium]|jgi:lactoylglutathione lyase
MKRFHVHLSVADLKASIGFYSRLFGVQPTVQKTDYAKWMLDDPRVNFAISSWNAHRGVDHLGLQADSHEELADMSARFAEADAASAVAEPNARCCYAVSDKHWVRDPQGVAWEAFHTLDAVPTCGPRRRTPTEVRDRACCAARCPETPGD